VLAHQNGERVGLVAGGAARYPNPQFAGCILAGEQAGDDIAFQYSERGASRKKLVTLISAEQQDDLLAVGLQQAGWSSYRVSRVTCMRRCTRRKKISCL
jgi:hypothetical protein